MRGLLNGNTHGEVAVYFPQIQSAFLLFLFLLYSSNIFSSDFFFHTPHMSYPLPGT